MGTTTYVAMGVGSVSGYASTSDGTNNIPNVSGNVGDRVFGFVGHSHNTAVTPTGWNTLLQNQAVGSGTPAAGSGLRYISVFYRDADINWNGGSATVSMPVAPTGAAANGAESIRLRKSDLGDVWNPPTVSAISTDFGTPNTSHSTSFTFTSHTGGIIMPSTVWNDATQWATTPGHGVLTGPGTIGAIGFWNKHNTASGITTGIGMEYYPITVGGTGTFNFTGTLGGSTEGGSILIEQTVSPPRPKEFIQSVSRANLQ